MSMKWTHECQKVQETFRTLKAGPEPNRHKAAHTLISNPFFDNAEWWVFIQHVVDVEGYLSIHADVIAGKEVEGSE